MSSQLHKILLSPRSSPRSSPKSSHSERFSPNQRYDSQLPSASAPDMSTARASSSSVRSAVASARLAELSVNTDGTTSLSPNRNSSDSKAASALGSPAEFDTGLKARSPRSPRVSQFAFDPMPAVPHMSSTSSTTAQHSLTAARNRNTGLVSVSSPDTILTPHSPGRSGNPYYNPRSADDATNPRGGPGTGLGAHAHTIMGSSATPRPRDTKRVYQARSPFLPLNTPSLPLPRLRGGKSIASSAIRAGLVLAAMAIVAFVLTRGPSPSSIHIIKRSASSAGRRGGYEHARRDVPVDPEMAEMLKKARAVRATRPTLTVRAIPSTHELLALQSYLLQSKHNVLPSSLDPAAPLDAHAILSVSPGKLGRPGSATERAWLKDLEREHEDDIIIWHGSGEGYHRSVTFLEKVSLEGRSPSLIDMTNRSDMLILRKLLARLGYSLAEKPLIVIGNQVVQGGFRELEAMRADGRLKTLMTKVGWWDEWKAEHGDDEDEDEEEEAVQRKAADKDKAKKEKAELKEKVKAEVNARKVEVIDDAEEEEKDEDMVDESKGAKKRAAGKAKAKAEAAKKEAAPERPRIMNAAFKKKT